jgi:DNA-binding GntR family transcriptional regulator
VDSPQTGLYKTNVYTIYTRRQSAPQRAIGRTYRNHDPPILSFPLVALAKYRILVNLDMDSAPSLDLAIPRQSLTSAVADKLRDQIIRGVIPEGAQLRQDAIANQFKVSRIPVREALRQLDAEGLISILPNRGAIVPALSPADIEELFSIRALLEPEVLKVSVPQLTEEDFSRADAVLKQYVKELRRDDHVSAWGRLNWEFHSILYSRADRPHFMSIIRKVNNNGERYTRLQLYLTHGIARANEEHHAILKLCRERSTAAACGLLAEHIRHAGQSLKEALQQRRGQDALADKRTR